MEDELTAAEIDGSIVQLLNQARTYSRPIAFWGMLPFGWDKRKLTSPLSLAASFAVLASLYAILEGIYQVLFLWNFLGLLWIAMGYMLGSIMGTICLKEMLENKGDKGHVLLRSWLIFESYKARRVLGSIRSLHQALDSYHTPVPREHYLLRHEQLRRLRRPMLSIFSAIIITFTFAAFIQFAPIASPYLYDPLLFLMSASLISAGAAEIYEQYYKPVLYREFTEGVEDALRHGLGVDVDQILRAFDSPSVFMRIRIKAIIGYALGVLSGWNIWNLGEPLVCLLLLGMYSVLPWYATANTLPIPYELLVVLISSLFVYSIIHSWLSGGGYRKAIERRKLLSHIITSFTLSELISMDSFREMVASASYNKEVSDATEPELLTRMVVESSAGGFR